MTTVYTSNGVAFSESYFLSAVAAGVLDGFFEEGGCLVGGGHGYAVVGDGCG